MALSFKRNMNGIDRVVRLVVGVALGYLALVETPLNLNLAVRYFIGAVAVVNLFAFALAFCPLYFAARINTFKRGA